MINKDKTILVLGAAGFLGSKLVQKLIAEGYSVITSDKRGNVDLKGDLSNESFTYSLPTNIHAVVNCAAVQYVTPNVPIIFRKSFFEKNNIKTARLLATHYKDTPVHFIHIGTSMMYRQTGDDLVESEKNMQGEGVYSISKMKAQTYINTIPKSATIVPCIIGGKGREGLFKSFVKIIDKFHFVVYPGLGTHKVHMVHVEDVAELIILAIKNNATGFFNAAAPDALSIKEWVDVIRNELGIKNVIEFRIPLNLIAPIAILSRYRLLAREQLIMLQKRHVLITKRAENLGWAPKNDCTKIVKDITKYISKGHK